MDKKLSIPEGAQTCILYHPERDNLPLINSSKKSQSLPDSSLFPVCCFNNSTDPTAKYSNGAVETGIFVSSECLKLQNVRDKHALHLENGYMVHGSPHRSKQLFKLTSLSADWSFKGRFSLKNDYKCISRRNSLTSSSNHPNFCPGLFLICLVMYWGDMIVNLATYL